MGLGVSETTSFRTSSVQVNDVSTPVLWDFRMRLWRDAEANLVPIATRMQLIVLRRRADSDASGKRSPGHGLPSCCSPRTPSCVPPSFPIRRETSQQSPRRSCPTRAHFARAHELGAPSDGRARLGASPEPPPRHDGCPLQADQRPQEASRSASCQQRLGCVSARRRCGTVLLGKGRFEFPIH